MRILLLSYLNLVNIANLLNLVIEDHQGHQILMTRATDGANRAIKATTVIRATTTTRVTSAMGATSAMLSGNLQLVLCKMS